MGDEVSRSLCCVVGVVRLVHFLLQRPTMHGHQSGSCQICKLSCKVHGRSQAREWEHQRAVLLEKNQELREHLLKLEVG